MRTEMEACEDKIPEKYCKNYKKMGYCDSKKITKVCKKTCDLCPKTNDEQGKFF